jgi:hypothetical protein
MDIQLANEISRQIVCTATSSFRHDGYDDGAEDGYHNQPNADLELAVAPVHHPLQFGCALAELTGMV